MKRDTQSTIGFDRGQVGIGTLIVFIAMVLVAAIAAGVLISTAGELQAQGEATGSESQSQVSDNIQVLTKTASVDEVGDNVSSLDLVVGPAAGANTIDLTETTIHALSSDASESLDWASTASSSEFETSNVYGTTNGNTLTSTGDRAMITIKNTTSSVVDNLVSGDSATLEIVDQSGATTYVEVRLPSSFADKNEVTV
ncbi:archaellin/type IV pilin N-terminal domain-containing protein [Halovivax limisalsi]|uniref:archaellin/type IV pilin N-terminal domain-containing protein n=1 Tax=Halovivax limisalsi TaxID=1453760 RepID=UPI001FFCE698|nr:archaellin/type IV pilin N-terminal domain-containing protein [Halovivax limisalsi]